MTSHVPRLAALLRRFALVAALLVASGYVLGLRVVWVFSERPCPPAHMAQPVGVMGGVWRCLPIGVTPPPGDEEWWNTLPVAYRERSVGVYLTNLQVRVFTYDEGSGEHFIGFNVPPPSY
jgi:hypothetical protein